MHNCFKYHTTPDAHITVKSQSAFSHNGYSGCYPWHSTMPRSHHWHASCERKLEQAHTLRGDQAQGRMTRLNKNLQACMSIMF